MNDPARHYRCNVQDFVSDLTEFVKERIGRAVGDRSDQLAATDVAAGVVPVIRERLAPEDEERRIPEDVNLWNDLALFLQPYFDNADGRDLASLGEKPRDEFLTEAKGLIERIERAQTNLLTYF